MYEKSINKFKTKENVFKNAFQAFLWGGLVCLFAEVILKAFNLFLDYNTSKSLMYFTIILIAGLLTGLGYYDKLGQHAKCGLIIPITGFSNSITSSAMEYKSEGIVLGILSNMLKLAGAVIVTGVLSGFLVGLIKVVFGIWNIIQFLFMKHLQ